MFIFQYDPIWMLNLLCWIRIVKLTMFIELFQGFQNLNFETFQVYLA